MRASTGRRCAKRSETRWRRGRLGYAGSRRHEHAQPPLEFERQTMPYRDMRDYLATIEQRGLIKRIHREVDRNWEVACLAKWMYQALPVDQRFGLYFQNIKGSKIPVVTAALGACPESVAVALQCDVDQINDKVVSALRNLIKPRSVETAVCHEIVVTGQQANLDTLPIVTWTPGKDKAPYLTTIVVTRDHDTGVRNMGVYRTMVRDNRSVVVNLSPNRPQPTGHQKCADVDRKRQKCSDCVGYRN